MKKLLLGFGIFFSVLVFCLYASENSFDPIFFTGNSNWDVSTFYEGQEGRPFIFIIQDAHCNEEVQYKIAEIIKFLKKRYGNKFKIIGIEGNSGEIDTSILKDMKDEKVKLEMSKNLMKKGMMTGAEYYDILHPNQVVLYGVEDVNIYNKNLSQIKQGLFDDKEAEEQVELIKQKNKNSKEIFYREGLYDLEGLEQKYKNNDIKLEVYLDRLIKAVNFKDRDLMNYPNIALFLRKQEIMRKIKFEELELETAKVISLADRHISKDDKKIIENMAAKKRL